MTKFFQPPADDKWVRDAACRNDDVEPEWFFPAQENGPSLSLARSVCQYCPVKQQCFEEAMAAEGGRPAKSRYGVFAGLTGGQRYALYERTRSRSKPRAA